MMDHTTESHRSFTAELRPIFATWERLRLLYNLTLLVIFVVLFHKHLGAVWKNWLVAVHLCFGWLGANLCFFAGPAAEAYARWLGLRSVWVTVGLFAGGVLLSIPLVALYGSITCSAPPTPFLPLRP